MDWIDNEEIIEILKNSSENRLLKLGDRVCYSDDFKYCLLVRNHASWEISGKGWRNANYLPENEGNGRLILNFYNYNKEKDKSSWFKIFIPKKYENVRLKNLGNKYKIIVDNKELIGEFKNHFNFMREFMTGFAESEELLKANLRK